jgi:hypothetical protein
VFAQTLSRRHTLAEGPFDDLEDKLLVSSQRLNSKKTHIHGADKKDVVGTKVDVPELPTVLRHVSRCLGIPWGGTQSA